MAIKKGDFVELDFTGTLADDVVFDTTIEKVAKENKIHRQNAPYQPVKVVVGERHMVPGLDDALVGKDTGKFEVEVPVEQAFGKKSSKLLKMVPAKEFKKQNIKPFVGLDVNIDGQTGTIRTVSGGRVIVDFNHPLAGKDLKYEVEVKRLVTDAKEKVETFFKMIGLPYESLDVKDSKATIKLTHAFPDNVKEKFSEECKRLTGVDAVFEDPEEKKE